MCAPFGPLSGDAWQDHFADATDVQKSMLELLQSVSNYIDFSNIGRLNAMTIISRGDQFSLPNDQWKIETIRQDSRVWSTIQVQLTDYAIGAQTSESNAYKYIKPPATPAQKEVCHAMGMRCIGWLRVSIGPGHASNPGTNTY